MNLSRFVLAAVLLSGPILSNADSFEVGKGQFLYNGEPFVIKAAELHYPRIPKEYWEQRIQLSKALGMNTICLYVFWNVHEGREDVFDFSGQNDLRAFINLCEENGMKVILRPGPYVCAEWEMGGLPWWLLKKKDIRLREDDPYFMERVEKFQKAVADQVADLTIDKGGPIIMVQVENEYGAYGTNKEYVGKIRDILRGNFGEEVTMFQCDWSSNFTDNGLDDLLWTMNFGTGADIDSQFARLRELRPESPLMCSEFWSGWFDKWGAEHETRSADEMIAGIDEMLSKDISFSLYMTHGGTNWGHWAGANSPGYSPDVTSYDYDAPISESGQPTEKFWLLRETLARHAEGGKESLPPLPELVTPIAIDTFTFNEYAVLWDNLPPAVHDEEIKTFEDYDQGFGSIIYSTQLPPIEAGTILMVNEPHDYARIFIDGKPVGVLDRRLGQKELTIENDYPEGGRLEILVEAMGRINFGRAIKDYKGITESVSIREPRQSETELKDWEVFLLPDSLDFYSSFEFRPLPSLEKGSQKFPPGVYRGSFTTEKPSDTFLDFSSWGKGLVYVNGHGLGRIWSIGPQQTLYLPGPWLKEGENEILIFDIIGPESPAVAGIDGPVIDRVRHDTTESKGMSGHFSLTDAVPVLTDSLPGGNGWKTLFFPDTRPGRYVCLEILSCREEGNFPALAEIYLLDPEGKRLGREKWKVEVDSENPGSGNHTSDKLIDLQESTYWQAADTADTASSSIFIDLGSSQSVSGIELLPRMESGAPGAPELIKVYVSDAPFLQFDEN